MRFVPVNCIRDRMISAKKLYGKNGELLLNAGSEIYTSYIEKIKELGYNGIYIDDELSKDIEITEVINENLRFKTIKALKNAFINIEKGKNLSDKGFGNINKLVGDVVENILENKNLIVNIIDLKVFDDYTFYHSVNVGVLSILIGCALNLNKNQLNNLGLSAMLHDIGKIFINKETLNKSGKLTSDEYEEVKSHSYKGYEYIKDMFNIPVATYIGILQHHERYDGTGYPNGTTNSQNSLFSKIISVCDVYDALTSERPYRKSLIPSEAAEYIMGGGGSIFDPEIVNIFIQKIAPYPIGTCVLLSNNKIGLVVENYSDCCLRPKVKIVKHGNEHVEPYFIDLREGKSNLGITIKGIGDVSCIT